MATMIDEPIHQSRILNPLSSNILAKANEINKDCLSDGK